jgi:hypothetical protein
MKRLIMNRVLRRGKIEQVSEGELKKRGRERKRETEREVEWQRKRERERDM